MESKLELAKQQIKQNHPDAKEDKIKQNVLEALDVLSSILNDFNSEHIEKIYEIETINPSYFPGLSKAASKTIVALRQANPSLSLDFILETVRKLANSGRPWESLEVFSVFGKRCRSEISQANIEYLMKVNSNIVEIVGYTISNEMRGKKATVQGSSINFFDPPPMQYDRGLINSIKEEIKRFQQPPSRLNFNF